MPSVQDRVSGIRRRRPLVDHLVRTQQHYGAVRGNALAGAVTFFAFLSFFPILALGFAVIGYVANVFPDAQQTLVETIEEVLPGMVTAEEEPGKIAISTLQDAAPAILSIGLPVMLYSGLGWLSAMRDALLVVFEKPQHEQPSFVVGKLKDLLAMLLLGLVLMLSVAVTGLANTIAQPILDLLQLGAGVEPLLRVLGVLLGMAASAVLFYAFFRLLGEREGPSRPLWSGAVLGAIGFELLKLLSSWLIKATAGQPAFQAFGIALILLVWINYFSRVVMYAAAWAHTAPTARAHRRRAALEADRRELEMKELAEVQLRETPPSERGRAGRVSAFAAGAASVLGVLAVLRRRRAVTRSRRPAPGRPR